MDSFSTSRLISTKQKWDRSCSLFVSSVPVESDTSRRGCLSPMAGGEGCATHTSPLSGGEVVRRVMAVWSRASLSIIGFDKLPCGVRRGQPVGALAASF